MHPPGPAPERDATVQALVRNEFAVVSVEIIAARAGSVLRIRTPGTERNVTLDALDLEALSRANWTALRRLLFDDPFTDHPGD